MAAVLLSALPVAAYDFEFNGVFYNIVKTDASGNPLYNPVNASVAQYPDELHKYSGIVEIPMAVTFNNKTYVVNAVESAAFYQCSQLVSVSLPNTVATIDKRAFAGCTNLRSINLGTSLREISNQCFSSCSRLESITLPGTVTLIDYRAFYKCQSLTSVIGGTSVKYIGEQAFYGCSALDDYVFPKSLLTIGNTAFYGCSSLTKAILPDALTSIGTNAFENCSALKTVHLPEELTTINRRAFYQCSSLAEINWPSSLSTINESAFYKCSALESINLPESLQSLGESAFGRCFGLQFVYLPNSLMRLPNNVFTECDLQYLRLGNNVKSLGNKICESSPMIEISTAVPPIISENSFTEESRSAITLVLPNAAIEQAYSKADIWNTMMLTNLGCVADVTVAAPGGLATAIAQQTGLSPAKLMGIKINGDVGSADFELMRTDMQALTRIDLSDCNITELPDEALKGKLLLNTFVLPTRLTSIGRSALANCLNLTGELVLPDKLISVGEYAFRNTAFTSLKINNELRQIGNYAFAGCAISNTPQFPDGLKSIGYGAFEDSGITGRIKLPSKLNSLGGMAFYNTAISGVRIPSAISSIGEGTFGFCTRLNDVFVPDNVMSIDNGAFEGCTSLSWLRLPPRANWVGEYAFKDTAIGIITIPDYVETLPFGVLEGCNRLVSLALPSTLNMIDRDALSGCINLRNMRVEAPFPPAAESDQPFESFNIAECIIAIPTDSRSQYELSYYWADLLKWHNTIDVTVEGNGQLSFDSSDNFDGALALPVYSNFTIYIPSNLSINLFITAFDTDQLLSATMNGIDIKPMIENDIYQPGFERMSNTLVVRFSGQASLPEIPAQMPSTGLDETPQYYNLLGIPVGSSASGLLLKRTSTSTGYKTTKVCQH